MDNTHVRFGGAGRGDGPRPIGNVGTAPRPNPTGGCSTFDAASDGTFPLITNDRDMSAAGLLAAYKGQPHLERRNH